ncbi:MAG: hypothetical protein OXF56_02755 [Rhodobacteraceae bacterium]|nr:hypothetical protein [Paracoccaceae bacterium]
MEDLRPTIKLMADYDCWPLWNLTEVDNVDPETLPLSIATKQALSDWQQALDRTLNRDDPLQSGFETPEEEVAFNTEGWRLWDRLRKELPDFKVVYFDHELYRVFDERPSGISLSLFRRIWRLTFRRVYRAKF